MPGFRLMAALVVDPVTQTPDLVYVASRNSRLIRKISSAALGYPQRILAQVVEEEFDHAGDQLLAVRGTLRKHESAADTPVSSKPAQKSSDARSEQAGSVHPVQAVAPVHLNGSSAAREYGKLTIVKDVGEKTASGQGDAAIDILQAAFAERDDSAVLLAFERNIETFASDFPSLFAATLLAVRSYMRRFMFQSALNALDPLFKDSRADEIPSRELSKARKQLAICLVRTGRLEEGIAEFERCLLERPLDLDCQAQLGLIYAAQRRPISEVHLMAAGLAGRGVSSTIQLNISEMFRQDGLKQNSISILSKLLEKRGASGEVILALHNHALELGEKGRRNAYLAHFFDRQGLLAPDIADEPFDLFGFRPRMSGPAESGPLVTVIMTTYNSSRTVRGAIRSVLDQIHRNIQLIVIDDKSDDGTQDILLELASADDRISVILNDVNMGTYCAKNIGMGSARGEYVTFHDSDDFMHPQRLSKHLLAMESPSLALTVSQWFRMDMDGYAVVQPFSGFVFRNPASTFFRREVLGQVGFFDSVRTGADTELLQRCRIIFGERAFLSLPETLAVGLYHDSSLTRSGSTAINEFRFSAVRLGYWEAFGRWHLKSESEGRLPFIPSSFQERPFDAPDDIQVNRGIVSSLDAGGSDNPIGGGPAAQPLERIAFDGSQDSQ